MGQVGQWAKLTVKCNLHMFDYVMYSEYVSIIFYSDEEPVDDDDFEVDDEHGDPACREYTDTGEASGGRDRSPIRRLDSVSGPSGSRGRSGRARGVRATGGRSRGGRGRAQEETGPKPKSCQDADIKNTLPPFKPSRPPGIHFERCVLRGAMTTELEFFHLFFTPEMIKSVVAHTNTNAFMKLLGGGYTSYTNEEGLWQNTTVEEINHLIALLIYFGLVNVDSAVEKYWSTKTLYHGLWARKILSRDRYKALMAFLHVVDPSKQTPGGKLHKVEDFLASFKERCSLLYQPAQNVAVDERMVKSRHSRSGIRQYMKNKPTRWGIKLWVLADSSNGYTVDFNVYIGKSQHEEPSTHGLGYDVVMKLVNPYLGQGYRVFFDNFFTSPKLVQDLFLKETLSSGTCRVDREGFPKSMKQAKVWARKLPRGSMRWVRESNVLILQWVDNRPVSLATSIDSANDSIVVKRRSKKRGVYEELDVDQPYAVHRYNQFMNGVDRSDQMLACHNVIRKCHAWWKVLFFHLIDIAVVNGFILFQQHRSREPDNPALQRRSTYTIVDFREEVVRQLCGLAEYDRPPVNETVRADTTGQFDTVHIPELAEGRVKRQCVVCYAAGRGQRQVRTYCSAPQCNKYLHVGGGYNCFREWHSDGYAGRR